VSIWFTPRTLDELNEREQQTAAGRCGVRFTAMGANWLEATVPLNHCTAAPDGGLHAGALAIIAETVGGIAANLCLDTASQAGVGQVLEVNHPGPVVAGPIRARATALALGEGAHLWTIDMHDSSGTWVANARLTVAIVRSRPRLRLGSGDSAS